MVIHKSVVRPGLLGGTLTTTLCGRMRTISDGMNIGDEVTCKFCLRKMASSGNGFKNVLKGNITVVEKLAADIVAEYPEITEESRRLRLRDQIVLAFGFCANSDNAMNESDSAAWLAAHSGVVVA